MFLKCLKVSTCLRCSQKLTVSFIIILIVTIAIYYNYRWSMNWQVIGTLTTNLTLKYVALHLDFKGAAPRIDYLIYILWPLKWLGVNALLLEYEDMFPYKGNIENISSRFHYTDSELKRFLEHAVKLDIELIPLVQTFGHMEFVLKVAEFQHLREDTRQPDSICPSKEQSLEVIEEMLRQIITFHQKFAPLKYLHIGCDEVRELNSCENCAKRSLSDLNIFLEHVASVAKIARSILPSPFDLLIWDDMIRKYKQNNLVTLIELHEKYNISPVYWDYTETLEKVSVSQVKIYKQAFKNIWAASAFKGADGFDNSFPDLHNRLLNNLNWLQFMQHNKDEHQFQGIILTGWSRYSHFRPLCELLPLSYYTLVPILRLIQNYKQHMVWNSRAIFKSEDWEKVSKEFYAESFNELIECAKMTQNSVIKHQIEGWSTESFHPICYLYSAAAIDLRKAVLDFDTYLNEYEECLMKIHISSILTFGLTNLRLGKLSIQLQSLMDFKKSEIVRAMKYFYSEHVINEYVLYKTSRVQKKTDLTLRMLSKGNVANAVLRNVIAFTIFTTVI